MAGTGDITKVKDRKAKELEAIRRVALEVGAILDLNRLLPKILQLMEEIFGFDHSMILIREEGSNELITIAHHGYPEEMMGYRTTIGKGIIGTVAQSKKLLRYTNLGERRAYLRAVMATAGVAPAAQEDARFPGLKSVQSKIAIPLLVGDRLIGVFNVESEKPYSFQEEDEALLTTVGSQLAIAIDNAGHYQRLEERVRQRTAELNRSNEELRQAYRELKETQAQLVQSEKMASLGRLVAGIAHELNTPIGAIQSHSETLTRCVKEVRETLENIPSVLTSLAEGEDVERLVSRLRAHYEENQELQFLLQDLDLISKNIQHASERVSTLVKNLRSFARLDEAKFTEADLHEGLESTLVLVHHELKNRIEVIREYGGLPKIRCSPNQLNQVFMNILVNASHAIEGKGVITIRTRRLGQAELPGPAPSDAEEFVEIAFQDTGSGMEPDILQKIFEPGFTTKRVGVGTGLGLAISYSIVEKHRGTILVESEVGRGSTFRVILPVVQGESPKR